MRSSDAAFILAYSIIMLNTDLHNRQVKKKMTKDQFVNNNRGIDEGADLPRDYLESIYDSIAEREISVAAANKWGPPPSKTSWLSSTTTASLFDTWRLSTSSQVGSGPRLLWANSLLMCIALCTIILTVALRTAA
jgi:Sec7-like guanine-nucleotide exchange factor